MTFPTPAHPGYSSGSSAQGASASCSGCGGFPTTSGEGEHHLEKLEFALAVALTRGDLQRSQQLRDQIAVLGGNLEEPGT